MRKIIYENPDKSVTILHPTDEVLSFASLEQIAEKDVPKDLPYWFIEETDIPSDRTFRSAWEIDATIGDPAGFGGESNEFDAELLAKWHTSQINDQGVVA